MTISNISTCPDCGGDLKHYDSVRRLIRTAGGDKHWIKVKRFRCVVCSEIHRALPDFIFPHKHYAASIIKGVIDGDITCETLGFEDYPCEMTMKRWTRK